MSATVDGPGAGEEGAGAATKAEAGAGSGPGAGGSAAAGVAGTGTETGAVAAARARAPNPFPGLRPFREDEDHLFFGRESQTDAMVDKLAATRFLGVIGSSGCGKSSLVECGLRVALRSGLMASAGTAWRIAKMRPGGDPIASLARALAADGVLFRDFRPEGLALEDIVETNLRMSRLGLVDVCEQARLGEGVNLLVIVDQFEELFRYRGTGRAGGTDGEDAADEASAFVNLLLEAKRQSRQPIHVVLTMRSDFLGDCARLPGLAEAINEGQYLVPRMSREERRLAIAGPIEVAGAGILPVLLTRLLNDLGDDPDQLSILQHALNRIWAAWQEEGGEGQLNLRHYSAIGSMSNALDRHAEKAFAELDEGRPRELCKRLLRALTDKSTDTRGVRRPTTFGTLRALTEASPDELGAIIDVFRRPGRSFLMPPTGEALEAGTVVDISHESLMRMWRRLVAWTDEEAVSARTYRRLAESAGLHERGEASLWRDPELQLALEWRRRDRPNEVWASRYGPGFARAVRFLDASAEARERERLQRREEESRERELDRARAVADEQAARIAAQAKAARVQRTVTRVVVAALLATLGLAFLASKLANDKTVLAEEAAALAGRTAALATEKAALAEEKAREVEERVRLENAARVINATLQEQKEVLQEQNETLEAQKRTLEEEQLRLIADRFQLQAGQVTTELLSRVIVEEATKRAALWQLVERGGLPRGRTPTTLTFVNSRTAGTSILTWEPDGVEIPRAEIGANGAEPVELFENDIWIARVVSSGRLVEVGIATGERVVLTSD